MKHYSILCITILTITGYSKVFGAEIHPTKQEVISQKCQKQCKPGEKCCVIPEYNDDDTDTLNTYCAKECYIDDPEID